MMTGSWRSNDVRAAATSQDGDRVLTCTGDAVRTRREPGLASLVAGTLEFGDTVRAQGDSTAIDDYTWLPVVRVDEAGAGRGVVTAVTAQEPVWVDIAFLDSGDTSNDPAPGTVLHVDTGELPVREVPRLGGFEIAVAVRGEEVSVTGPASRRDGFTWYPVQLADGTSGNVAGEFLAAV